MVITSVKTPENKRFEGMPLTEIAAMLDKDPYEVAFDIRTQVHKVVKSCQYYASALSLDADTRMLCVVLTSRA